MDITNEVSTIIELFIDMIVNTWEMMENIEFMGTNLLVITVTIAILGAMIPLLITTIKDRNTNVRGEIRKR